MIRKVIVIALAALLGPRFSSAPDNTDRKDGGEGGADGAVGAGEGANPNPPARAPRSQVGLGQVILVPRDERLVRPTFEAFTDEDGIVACIDNRTGEIVDNAQCPTPTIVVV